MKFQHTITLLVTTEENNPDMPSLNVNTLAGRLRDEATALLSSDVVGGALKSVEVVVAEARRTY